MFPHTEQANDPIVITIILPLNHWLNARVMSYGLKNKRYLNISGRTTKRETTTSSNYKRKRYEIYAKY